MYMGLSLSSMPRLSWQVESSVLALRCLVALLILLLVLLIIRLPIGFLLGVVLGRVLILAV